MKVVKISLENRGVVPPQCNPSKPSPDDRVESLELICAFRDLAVAIDGLCDYSNDHTIPATYVGRKEFDEDFRPFHDLAAAGVAFMKHNAVTEKEGKLQKEFADISRANLNALFYENYYLGYCFYLDHDAHIPRAGLFMFDPYTHLPLDYLEFWTMEEAWQYTEDHVCECEIYLWGEALDCFWSLWSSVEGFRDHTWDLEHGRVLIDWSSTDVALARDIPTAALLLLHSKKRGDASIASFAFCELVEAVEDCFNWRPSPKFPDFLRLPAEIRIQVIHEYLMLEREAGRLRKHAHVDEWRNPCCVWDYPDTLIACDNQNPDTFPPPETARAPSGWLPNLAFTSKDMLGEVAVHMLQNTKRFELKYMYHETNFKIATWMRKFLAALPNNEGLDAVKHLNFPHMHWFNYMRDTPSENNPSIELAVACRKLEKLDMTFHWSKVTYQDADTEVIYPCPVEDVIDRFKLEGVLQCTNLRAIRMDGIHDLSWRGGEPEHLDALGHLAKWFLAEFLVRQQRKIQVEVVRRSGAWRGRVAGELVTLSKEELEGVDRRIASENSTKDESAV